MSRVRVIKVAGKLIAIARTRRPVLGSLIVLHCAEFHAKAQRCKDSFELCRFTFCRFAPLRENLLMITKKACLQSRFCSLVLISGCRPSSNLPTKSSPQYNELVRTFYIGLAALEVGHDVQADAKLAQFTQLAAAEPAGWANWGLLALRQRNYDTAAERLNKARDLAPDNSQIFYLIGLLESSRGNTHEAITALRKSVELDQNNLIAVYKLAEEVERQGDDKSAEEFQTLIQKILAAQPDNLAALVEQSRIAAKRGDAETFKSAVAKIVARSSSWPDEVKEQVNAVDALAKSGDLRAGATRTSFLRNVLMRVPEYRRNLAAIKPPPGEEAIAFTHFLKVGISCLHNCAG